MMFAVRDVVLYSIVAGVLAMAVLAAWPWARERGTFAVVGVATALGMMAWNGILHVSNTASLNVDAPVIGVSWQDAGSGVWAFLATALALGLIVLPEQPARRVVGAAGIAGVVAMVFDIFVL
jgi:hypothetical protein